MRDNEEHHECLFWSDKGNVLVQHSRVMTLLLISSFTLLASSSFGFAKADYPFAHNNEIIDNIIPMSQTTIPEGKRELARQKAEKIFNRFKAPGQQLMPLGMYTISDPTDVRILRDLRSHGIFLPLLHGGTQSTARTMKVLKTAEAAGIGVLKFLSRKHFKEDSQYVRSQIQAYVDNKQIMLWYLPEESQPEELDHLKKLADIIRSVDPYHRPLTTFVESGQETHWQNVSQIVDVMIVGGIYPTYKMHKIPRADIRRCIDFAHELDIPVVLSVVEAYKDIKASRWPTPQEVRFDAYLCLISGSKGLFWYGHAYLKDNQELYDAVLKIAYELNGPTRLGEVFLVGERVNSIECRLIRGNPYAPPTCAYEKEWWKKDDKRIYSSLQWLALKHKNSIYLFAVNMNEEVGVADHGGKDYAVTVRFEKLPDTITNVEVLFEDRQIVLENHSFVDSFDPIGTHIYRLEAK